MKEKQMEDLKVLAAMKEKNQFYERIDRLMNGEENIMALVERSEAFFTGFDPEKFARYQKLKNMCLTMSNHDKRGYFRVEWTDDPNNTRHVGNVVIALSGPLNFERLQYESILDMLHLADSMNIIVFARNRLRLCLSVLEIFYDENERKSERSSAGALPVGNTKLLPINSGNGSPAQRIKTDEVQKDALIPDGFPISGIGRNGTAGCAHEKAASQTPRPERNEAEPPHEKQSKTQKGRNEAEPPHEQGASPFNRNDRTKAPARRPIPEKPRVSHLERPETPMERIRREVRDTYECGMNKKGILTLIKEAPGISCTFLQDEETCYRVKLFYNGEPLPDSPFFGRFIRTVKSVSQNRKHLYVQLLMWLSKDYPGPGEAREKIKELFPVLYKRYHEDEAYLSKMRFV